MVVSAPIEKAHTLVTAFTAGYLNLKGKRSSDARDSAKHRTASHMHDRPRRYPAIHTALLQRAPSTAPARLRRYHIILVAQMSGIVAAYKGRIRTNRWEDAETGEQRSGVEIVIHELIMLDSRGTTPEDAADERGTPASKSSAAATQDAAVPALRQRQHVHQGQAPAPSRTGGARPARRASTTPDDDLPL